MKRYGNLFSQITSMDNLLLAYHRAKKGKSSYTSVKKFSMNVEENLLEIQSMLLNKTFHTSPYEQKTVFEPKERTIYVLPFYPDRIVQHALMAVLAPIWEPMFIRDSYACIENRGQHRGSKRTMEFIRHNTYCLKCDVAKFYPSVDHEILLNLIRHKIKCKDTMWLIEDIINSFPDGKNVPIGNYTSQWFGNYYLTPLDKFCKTNLGIKHYIRYCDDFLLLGNDKKYLNQCLFKIVDFLDSYLKLSLSKSDLFQVSRGIDYLGYRHFTSYILVRKSTTKRTKKRISKLPSAYSKGYISAESMCSTIGSTMGWLRWSNSHHLRQSLNLRNLHIFALSEVKRKDGQSSTNFLKAA